MGGCDPMTQPHKSDSFETERIEIAMCPICGAWLPWATVEAIGGLDHRHNAQMVEFEKRSAVMDKRSAVMDGPS